MFVFIEKRLGKRGTTYRVQVIIKSECEILHRESRSFSQRREGDSWGAARDKALPKAIDDPE